jgi:hypothetical protein
MFALNGTNGVAPANVAGALNMAASIIIFFNAPTCAVYDDSSNSLALSSSAIDLVTVKSIGVVGGYKGGFFSFTCNGGPPCPATGIVPVSDPLSYLIPPTGACTPSHYNFGSAANPIAATNPLITVTGSTWTIQPGTYCGSVVGGVSYPAINLASAPHALTFAPGTYVIDGGGVANAGAAASGGLNVSGSSGLTANGVTFYLRNGASFNIAPNLAGSFAGVTLTAPSSGTYSGILFYQDRADTSPAYFGNVVSFIHLEGVVYLPVANLSFPSVISGVYSHYAIYVANTFTFQAALSVFQDYANAPSNGSGKSPIETVVLVE